MTSLDNIQNENQNNEINQLYVRFKNDLIAQGTIKLPSKVNKYFTYFCECFHLEHSMYVST